MKQIRKLQKNTKSFKLAKINKYGTEVDCR